MLRTNEKNFFILMGPSGSGKGTQAKLLMKYLKNNTNLPLSYLSTGESFRKFIKKQNYTAKLTKDKLESGSIAPQGLAIAVWVADLLNKIKENQNIILDGAPRAEMEAVILEEMLQFLHYKNIYVIHYNADSKELIKRVVIRSKLENRNDDNIKSLKNKMKWFESTVMPAIKYYKTSKKVKFIEINANDSVENVFSNTIKKL